MQAPHMPAPYPAFGELLARLRVAAGFTKQQELATALGVTQQSVSRWERGLARPRLLASLSRAEPAFDLYDRLLKDARYAIARQRKSKEAIEEEDD